MKRVLVIQYSQSGQLHEVMRCFCAPLAESDQITLQVETLRPAVRYPFPWPFFRFFDTFPEAVYLDAPELEPLSIDPDERFDLVILGYQVWFLSPSLPVTGFLKSETARRLLRDTPVVTVIACRDMWLMAQEQVKQLLAACAARLVGNVALVDEAGSVGSFLATPLWVMTGRKGPRWGGLIPRAGVQDAQIRDCRRFGERIREVLGAGGSMDGSLLRNLGAVTVNERLISAERLGRRSFLLWGGLLRRLGRQGAVARKPALVLYVLFLATLLLTVVPAGVLLKALVAPLRRRQIAAEKAYFAEPSGP